MSTNKLIALAAAVREALATSQSLIASSPEEQEARLELIDLIPELNAALLGDVEHLRELAWSVGLRVSPQSYPKSELVFSGRPRSPGCRHQPLERGTACTCRQGYLLRRALGEDWRVGVDGSEDIAPCNDK